MADFTYSRLENLPHAKEEAKLLLDFFPLTAGSEHRPHQKLQSLQQLTVEEPPLRNNLLKNYKKE